MKRAIVLALLVTALALPVTVSGQIKEEYWKRLPDSAKVHFYTHDYSGKPALSLMCFLNTIDNWKALWGPEWEEKREAVELLLNFLADRWPGSQSLVVYVAGYGTQYFWPWEMAFTQGHAQFNVQMKDVVAITDAFNGGRLLEGAVAWGYIRIPQGIDTSKEFRIWYDDEYGTMKPEQPAPTP
ncbi:hypothetical protein H5T56_03750 [Candidatus Bipolaricaulota bacterium]|nr:hypothetical protein [Candidatus Bipolaricaulota bacterium]